MVWLESAGAKNRVRPALDWWPSNAAAASMHDSAGNRHISGDRDVLRATRAEVSLVERGVSDDWLNISLSLPWPERRHFSSAETSNHPTAKHRKTSCGDAETRRTKVFLDSRSGHCLSVCFEKGKTIRARVLPSTLIVKLFTIDDSKVG